MYDSTHLSFFLPQIDRALDLPGLTSLLSFELGSALERSVVSGRFASLPLAAGVSSMYLGL